MRIGARLRELGKPSVEQLKRLWKPFVVIQLFGLAVILAYFFWPSFARWCDSIGAIKTRWGVFFAMITMPISAGIVPEIVKTLTGVEKSFPAHRWRTIGFHLYIFAVSGVISDGFYQLLAMWPGDSRDVATVATKVALDQFVYTPFFGVPYLAFWYTLRANRFSVSRTRAMIGRRWYINDVVPLLLPCWAFWIPMCSLMYLLPPALTYLFAVTANAAAATILIAVAGRKRL
ncbi:MAG TPA: hypothetical protein PK402_11050 [Tepidisphaeraceae bacterium]|nr:hypothetical protein [Tepidisphaeraceae bacterium]